MPISSWRTAPSPTGSAPASTRASVVLPAPLAPTIAILSPGAAVRVLVFDGDAVIAEGTGPAGEPIKIAIAEPKLWGPETPFLYDVKATVGEGDGGDAVGSYFGMRKIAIGKDEAGVLRLTAETLADLDAIEPGHHDVEADEIGCGRRHSPQGGWPVDRFDDVVALPRQQLVQPGKVGRFVVDREDQRPVVRLGHARQS